jgi:peptidyl-prolyl cis-trans isomerase B (cyclophilin B)
VTRTQHRVAAALLPIALASLLSGCGSSAAPAAKSTVLATPSTTTSAASGPCQYPTSSTPAAKAVHVPPSTPNPSDPTSITLATNQGDIPITLEPKTAPCAVNSFISLARQGYFDKTKCHRLTTVGYYVLQCGDPTGTGQGGPGYTFKDELLTNDPRLQPCTDSGGQALCTYNAGVVAMANAGPDTNGSQFFLVYGPSQFPPAYTVLGHMDAAGLKVVKAIGAAGVGALDGMGPGDGSPKQPVVINAVKQ